MDNDTSLRIHLDSDDADADDLLLTFEVDLDANDDDTDCEICDDPIPATEIYATTTSLPYDHNSAVTSHVRCLPPFRTV